MNSFIEGLREIPAWLWVAMILCFPPLLVVWILLAIDQWEKRREAQKLLQGMKGGRHDWAED